MKKTTSLRAFYWGVKLFEQFAFIKLNAYIYIYIKQVQKLSMISTSLAFKTPRVQFK